MRKRTQRQDAIRTIVRRERIRTQRDLVEHLKQAGFSCTQATVSRDIADMGLRKLPEGVYVLAEDIHLQRMIAELVEDVVQSQQLVLVKTTAGGGQGVAAALDAASIDKILGSIAGDDTILIVTADETAAQAIVKGLDKFRGRN
ncbi:MAG TPA: ArgR family transcriptional regulator [Coriobacteriia bacterium]|nr:MAG: Arginine repressor [Actinobacteria bacterium 66_15]HAL29222.1 ArgR family transcriptional regulator [Coriobacteriia bacterium]